MGGDKPTVEIPLWECLVQAFADFHHWKTKWGLVTDVRADGSTYKRHGIIVKLTIDMKGIFATECKSIRIRQAIDLAKLALALDPHAMLPLLIPESSSSSGDNHAGDDDEEIKAFTEGDAPFELRVKLTTRSSQVGDVEWSFVKHFMRALDLADVRDGDRNPNALRRYLVERVRSTPSARRLIHLPVRTKLKIAPLSKSRLTYNIEDAKCEELFEQWALASEALHLYQSGRAKHWDMDIHYAPVD